MSDAGALVAIFIALMGLAFQILLLSIGISKGLGKIADAIKERKDNPDV